MVQSDSKREGFPRHATACGFGRVRSGASARPPLTATSEPPPLGAIRPAAKRIQLVFAAPGRECAIGQDWGAGEA